MLTFSYHKMNPDEEIANVAKNWFGLSDDIRIHIGDGLEYIKNAANSG
jgi:spermidine synthase